MHNSGVGEFAMQYGGYVVSSRAGYELYVDLHDGCDVVSGTILLELFLKIDYQRYAATNDHGSVRSIRCSQLHTDAQLKRVLNGYPDPVWISRP